MKTVTWGDFVAALRKNGLDQIRNFYFRGVDEHGTVFNTNGPIRRPYKVVAGCAIGQAALNLGVDATLLDSALYKSGNSVGKFIRDLNDYDGMSINNIADELEKKKASLPNDFDIIGEFNEVEYVVFEGE